MHENYNTHLLDSSTYLRHCCGQAEQTVVSTGHLECAKMAGMSGPLLGLSATKGQCSAHSKETEITRTFRLASWVSLVNHTPH